MAAVGLWGPDGQGTTAVRALPELQCAAVKPFDVTKTAQYGRLFSRKRPLMERGEP